MLRALTLLLFLMAVPNMLLTKLMAMLDMSGVTYEGTDVYPDAPAPYKAAPVPAYAG